ncbi:Roundabout-like 2 [Stylophora pistillata]|uniref:Roundabout-like 2 n=1 Tax=Stylophora pistillata TaxID=50429 RepID=A0A2B4R836_STYPI|nr:Roundabout-like 2 [Stylophora pistillata]
MINKRTEMNELRILAVESRMKMTNKADENVENKPKTFTGVKGNKGDKGSVGATGIKGETGAKGLQGRKGSIGSKGNKGNKGSVGIQGPKGECVVPMRISVYPVSQEVFAGETAIFYCWVQGQTSSTITWRKLGGVLSDATVEEGALRISKVQSSHVGSYMCTARTGLGMLRTISRLQIKESPKFTNKPSSEVILAQGTTASLCCEATGSPPPRIEWYRAQKQSVSIPVNQEDRCLLVNTDKENAEGDYICRATSRLGLAETVTTVIATRLIGMTLVFITAYLCLVSTSSCHNNCTRTTNQQLK